LSHWFSFYSSASGSISEIKKENFTKVNLKAIHIILLLFLFDEIIIFFIFMQAYVYKSVCCERLSRLLFLFHTTFFCSLEKYMCITSPTTIFHNKKVLTPVNSSIAKYTTVINLFFIYLSNISKMRKIYETWKYY
jgi:hypothetical protein